MEGKTESTEVMDQQGGEENEQDRHENPKQRPQEVRHSAANAHGAHLPANSQSMPAMPRKVQPSVRGPSQDNYGTPRFVRACFGYGEIGQPRMPSANER